MQGQNKAVKQRGGVRKGFNDYRVEGDVAYIILTDRKGGKRGEALIDAADLPELIALGRRWFYVKREYTAYVLPSAPTTYLHRVIAKPGVGLMVDHINGNGLDNRRANLRECNAHQNQHNRRNFRETTSAYKGVGLEPGRTDLWRARITHNGRRIYLGVFDTELAAAKAYDTAALSLHGEFACVIFPPEPQPVVEDASDAIWRSYGWY